METTLKHERGYISLGYKDPATGERFILAGMTLYEGTGCWRLVDIRLCQYRTPSPYSGGLNADVYCATHRPKSPEERALLISQLREYEERPDGEIVWCSYDGVVPGHPTVNGYAPVRWYNDPSGFFCRAEGLAKLKEIQAFWNTFEGDPATVRLPNPLRQPSESAILSQMIIKRMQGELPAWEPDEQDAEGFYTPPPAPAGGYKP